MRTLLILGALSVSTGLAFAQATDDGTATDETAPPVGVSEPSQLGLETWAKIYEVFSHPRCANCHVEDEHPRWSGDHYGAQAGNHAMNIQRGPDGFGHPALQCQTCHGESNSAELHGPPGAPHWHLAPAEMVWFEKSSSHICNQIKDPARNGDMTLEEVAVHVRDDKLVAWGWAPGKGREPAPGSAEETYRLLQTWIAESAPCPSE